MKNKLLTVLLLSVMAVGILACGNKDSNLEPSGEVSTTQTESDGSESSTPEESSERTLEDIEKFMLDNGAVSGERTQMVAEIIGGIAGFKYSDSGVEIYEYDVNTEEYISLSNGEEIPLQGMDGFTIGATAINGKFVLMGEPSQEAIDIFNSFR